MPQPSGTTGVMEVDVSVSGCPDQLGRVKGQEPSDGCEELVSDPSQHGSPPQGNRLSKQTVDVHC